MLKRILLALLVLFIAAYGYVSWTLSNRILTSGSSLELTKSRIQQHWGSTLEDELAALPQPQDFEMEGFEGVTLKGKYFQRPDTADCVVIFAHGWSSTWAGMLKYSKIFWECGCDMVLYDHRAHGNSTPVFPTAGIKEKEDLLLVTEWVKKELGYSSNQIGWMGASWGAATVLMAGASDKDVAFIAADAPFQDWYSAIFERAVRDYGTTIHLLSYGVMSAVNWRAGIDYEEASPLKAASKIKEPVLLIHSQMDAETASKQSVNIAKELNAENSVFHHIDWGGGHTKDVIIHKERFAGLIHDFLQEKVSGFGNCE